MSDTLKDALVAFGHYWAALEVWTPSGLLSEARGAWNDARARLTPEEAAAVTRLVFYGTGPLATAPAPGP